MILTCTECGEYGLSQKCGCGGKRVNPKPPKYNPDDKYSKYRAKYKKEEGLF